MNIKIKGVDKDLTKVEIEGENQCIYHYGFELSEQPDELWGKLLYRSHAENPNSYRGRIQLTGSSFKIIPYYPHVGQIRDLVVEIVTRANQQYNEIQTAEKQKKEQYELKEQEKENKRKIEEDAFKGRLGNLKFDD